MSQRQTKTALRFLLAAAMAWLASTAGALAQDVTMTLTPAEIAVLTQALDLVPTNISPPPPQAFWEAQAAINRALQANPDALRAVLSLRSAAK
jgi:hypothetical protein